MHKLLFKQALVAAARVVSRATALKTQNSTTHSPCLLFDPLPDRIWRGRVQGRHRHETPHLGLGVSRALGEVLFWS